MHEAILLEAEAAHKKGELAHSLTLMLRLPYPRVHSSRTPALSFTGELAHSLTLMRNCSAALLPPVSKRFLSTFGAVSPAPFTVVPT